MRIYMSSSPRDREFVTGLASHLKKAGFKVWYDAWDVYPGDNWGLAIGKALEKSNAMVVVLSPEAVKSTSVQRDIDYALGALQFAWRLIPVELRPTKDMPWILRQMHVIRASKSPGQTARRIIERLCHNSCRSGAGVAGRIARRSPIQLHPPIAEAAV
jgi:hypothetical protein